MIILPGKPHMYSEAEAAVSPIFRFTSGIPTEHSLPEAYSMLVMACQTPASFRMSKGRFRMFPRTPGISTTSQRKRVAAALAHGQPGAPDFLALSGLVDANRSKFVASSSHWATFGQNWTSSAPLARQEQPERTLYVHGTFDLFNPVSHSARHHFYTPFVTFPLACEPHRILRRRNIACCAVCEPWQSL